MYYVNVECNGGTAQQKQKRNSSERTAQGDGEGVCNVVQMYGDDGSQQQQKYDFYLIDFTALFSTEEKIQVEIIVIFIR